MSETKEAEPVQKKTSEEEKVKVSIEGAVSGKRQRGWTIQNKCRQIAELKDKVKIPVISLFTDDPTEVPEESWGVLTTPNKVSLLCCQKTILMVSDVVMQPEMDKENQVVLRMHVLAPKDDSINKDIFWKQTWGKFMHLGSLSWEDLANKSNTAKKPSKSPEPPSLEKLKISTENMSTNASKNVTD